MGEYIPPFLKLLNDRNDPSSFFFLFFELIIPFPHSLCLAPEKLMWMMMMILWDIMRHGLFFIG